MSLLVFALSYLMGSLSPSQALARKGFRDDLRDRGSGNLGAFNIYFYFKPSPLSALLGAFTGFLIIVKHRQNFIKPPSQIRNR